MTVYTFLAEIDCLDILADPLWETATQSINVNNVQQEDEDSEEYGQKKINKRELAAEVARKRAANDELLQKYGSEGSEYAKKGLKASDVQRIIDSISDNESYYEFNVRPVVKMLTILKESFHPDKPNDPFSLSLAGSASSFVKKSFSSFSFSGYSSNFRGSGAMLNHNHSTQYKFVLQSLTLWKEIMTRMPRLWLYADMDMTTEAYRLVDTGQGYQRLQGAPRVRREMSEILHRVQSRAGPWVGLSVVHLADRDVPNALIFIDKYTQVPRILSPIAQCIEQLPNLVEDPAFHTYVREEWGSIDGLRMQILSDFFKHGFDGSGDDGGSCIDGRLTSAWNWCSKLHKKPYYYVFMFTGFQGFDGDWKGN